MELAIRSSGAHGEVSSVMIEQSFPRVEAYIRQLPEGLDSFPDCRAKASIHRKVYEYSGLCLAGLPPRLQDLLDNPPPPSSQINQCQTLAMIVAMVEARELPPAEESLWIREAATHLFASPIYKILMWAATPRMVFKTANLRWSAFFRGTSIACEVGAREALVRLQTPTRLFNEDLARIFIDVLHAAVNYTKDASASARIEFLRFTTEGLEYAGRW
jgi:hypothetical protein